MVNNELLWLSNLKNEVLNFLEHQKSKNKKGYYSYSYSGDIYDEKQQWNVGSSVFALRCYYTVGINNSKDIEDAKNYILKFQEHNYFYDKFIYKKSFLKNFLLSIKNNEFFNLFNIKYKTAETRQVLSTLLLFDAILDNFNVKLPSNIQNYISQLNWKDPWGAGSHFAHIMFLNKIALKQKQITQEEYLNNVKVALNFLDTIQHSENGGWYNGNPDNRIIINGAMKVITGLQNADISYIKNADRLIDICLESASDEQACDNFNIIFVLHYCNKVLNSDYRYDEIQNFALNRLKKYKAHYKQDEGGFSFYPFSSNVKYYGVEITKGKNESDIHGTFLFLYGISLILNIRFRKRVWI